MSRRGAATELLRGVHVLVVDDDVDARELLGIVLGTWGAVVTVAASAREALAVLDHIVPDVLVSDISMPGLDGYWLIRQIRALPPERGGALPAIAVTALGATHGPERARGSGFQAHMQKPVNVVELARVICDLTHWPSRR